MTTLALAPLPVIGSVKEVGQRYKTWLVDIWGVMHDGTRAYEPAVEAVRAFRAAGGLVLLLSNSPRPSPGVKQQLAELGVPPDAYDATVTSGDLTRHELDKQPGVRVFHLGPERDRPIFAGLDVELVGADAAELIVCSGLVNDETETPENYAELLERMAAQQLPMLCANPDHRVERGRRLVYCAGALAAVYEGFGGQVVYAGKPYLPIYALAMQTAGDLAGREVERREVLAIGDGVHTDIAGAVGFGLDAVFVVSGLHVANAPADGASLDGRKLAELFAGSKPPLAAMRALVW
jgi:HAD superfamily hydrolase (TIGR01459 family)